MSAPRSPHGALRFDAQPTSPSREVFKATLIDLLRTFDNLSDSDLFTLGVANPIYAAALACRRAERMIGAEFAS